MDPTVAIPFNYVSRVGTESRYIEQAFDAMHICGDGLFTRQCHEILEREIGTRKALLTTSCTHALEMAAMLLDIRRGDEVLVPSFTFPSALNAFVLRGAKPVFVDIRPDTLNLDEKLLRPLITRKTRAILATHYAGVGCEMNEICALANESGISVVEDNAHGLFGRYAGKPLGTFGRFGVQSFHETKNFSCGEGGALLINSDADIERAEIIREKGTDRKRFFRGEVDKYTWVDIGSSYLPSDILAAILLAQLEVRKTIQAQRRAIWTKYKEGLSDWAAQHDVALPTVPPYCDQTYHLFHLLMPDLEARTALINHLKANQIQSVFHYMPLHLSRMGLQFGGFPGQCPVSEYASDRVLRLPLYNTLTESDQTRIIEAIYCFDMPRASATSLAVNAATGGN